MTGERSREVAAKYKIPWTTVVKKARKTALGFLWVGLAVLITWKFIPPLSHWVVYPLLVYGGYCLAGDIMGRFFDWLPAVLRDLASAIKDLRNAWKG